MKRVTALLLLFLTFFVLPTPASAALKPDDESTITEGLRDKGFDWLKDKASEAGQEWVFGTGQSDVMHEILIAARERADGEGNNNKGRCQYAVMSKASSILNDINYKTTAQNAGKLAFDTVTKMASLASGFGGAAAEGGALDWLMNQYIDAAKGAGKDAVFDRLKKLFIDEKKPEFELFEKSGKNGNCDYTLRAVWDIVHGTYRVYIEGDCHCTKVGQFGLDPTPLGKWWISFEGHVQLVRGKEKDTVSWSVGPVTKMDFDAQCGCSDRPLKTAFAQAEKKQTTSVSGGGGTTAPPPTPTGPPPLPQAGRKVCKECQDIQDKIDADTSAVDKIKAHIADLANEMTGAKAKLESDQGKLTAVKESPKDYDITPEAVQKQIDADEAEVKRIKDDGTNSLNEQLRLEKELRELATKLDECLKKNCPDGHSSVSRPATESYAAVEPRKPACGPQPAGALESRLLAMHNAERSAVGAQPLCWNPQLAMDAAAWAQQLAIIRQLVHAPREGRGIERENLQQTLKGWGPDRMLRDWIVEKRDFTPGYYPGVARDGNWLNVSHYTQMIWPTTTDIGCGYAEGGGYGWLVCRYSPGGNKDGKPVGFPTQGIPERG